jgi:hypothetical protein
MMITQMLLFGNVETNPIISLRTTAIILLTVATNKIVWMMKFASMILAALFTWRRCTHFVIPQRMMKPMLAERGWTN